MVAEAVATSKDNSLPPRLLRLQPSQSDFLFHGQAQSVGGSICFYPSCCCAITLDQEVLQVGLHGYMEVRR